MSLNWKEIERVLSELDLENCFLQEIRQYDFHHILFQLYGKSGETNLLISLEQGALRLHRTNRKRRALPKPPRFTTFLKARVKGGKITSVGQIGTERIIRFHILRAGESFSLYIKLWENNANIIITDNTRKILDCFTRRPNRGEVPGQIYNPEELLKDAGNSAGDPDRFQARDFLTDDEEKPAEDYNSRVERYYGSKESTGERDALRREAERSLKAERKRLNQRRDKLSRRAAGYEDPEGYKKWGDLIMSRLHEMKRGDKWLETTDWTEEGEEITLTVELDPQLTPAENGERYYKRYKKALAGKELVAEELEQLDKRLSHLEENLAQLPGENDKERLKELVSLEKQRKTKNESPTPGLQFRSGPFLILVGRNSRENDELLRRHVRGNDLWLHNRDWPGGYVFIKTIKGKSVPLDVLLDAGNLAIHYSRGKKAGRADLYYTEVKYLRRAKGAARGTVLPTREKNLAVDLDKKRLSRLLS